MQALSDRGEFAARHIGLSDADTQLMLSWLGLSSLDELTELALPSSIRVSESASPVSSGSSGLLGVPASEPQAAAELAAMGSRNRPMISMIGAGYYDTVTPAVIRRNMIEDPGWYTAYTPYQPEISQGRLEALLNFQTMISDLSGLQYANASLLDEPTAAAEAMGLIRRANKGRPPVLLVDSDTHPQTLAVLRTRAVPVGVRIVVRDLFGSGFGDEPAFGVVLGYPTSSGAVRDPRPVIHEAHAAGALVVVCSDPLALTLLADPASMGADVVVGSAQRFGVPMAFGGPHAAFIAVRAGLERQLPGRLVGVSRDARGRMALRLAVQTREQHIRRERATSNICTSQALLAMVAATYAVYHGPQGLRGIANRVHGHARALADGLVATGWEMGHTDFFDTLRVKAPGRSGKVLAAAAARGINLLQVGADEVGISVDEVTTDAHVREVLAAFAEVGPPGNASAVSQTLRGLPSRLASDRAILTHPVFHQHRSETALMRYLRRLKDADMALDRTMIPLGSCTMKLNAAAALEPISRPEWASIHPFAPADQTSGYSQLTSQLATALAQITGYDAVSLQPNAGSQGELAGLLAIRGYLADHGGQDRDVCLIPASAHGTNAASAVLAGLHVVVVACDDAGNVDYEDLTRLIGETGERLAALMVTYPSTHGVYEPNIVAAIDAVHSAGGQVYVDGANLNALVGLSQPGSFGADVSHLNLHKTFAIPHGGGGPGVGPVAVRAHLAPYLPGHPLRPDAGPAGSGWPDRGQGPISGAPWGSAGVLPISWMYLRLLGGADLRRATQVAVLSANYLAARLSAHYRICYTGPGGLVAHECILDLRDLTRTSGVTAEDVAKRLIDYGFHAPTMSFPVAGTLMVEPTESEPLRELDRFVDAMIAIRAEIEQIVVGEMPLTESPLRRAPHTGADLVADWDRPYSREKAVFPTPEVMQAKYWPPVNRIDAAYGDRNLFCSCPAVGDQE